MRRSNLIAFASGILLIPLSNGLSENFKAPPFKVADGFKITMAAAPPLVLLPWVWSCVVISWLCGVLCVWGFCDGGFAGRASIVILVVNDLRKAVVDLIAMGLCFSGGGLNREK